MIHYHGGPITPVDAELGAWTGHHAFVSFFRPEQIGDAAEASESFALDNGAFSHWRSGKGAIDVGAFAEWVAEWSRHPGFDWCLAPDIIDGSEQENDEMLDTWASASHGDRFSVPVWHLHESLGRLRRLVTEYPRVALGSSGQYRMPKTPMWWARMHEAMGAACDEDGRPLAKLHGLRMMCNTIRSHIPLASADSTDVARNHARTRRKLYPVSKKFAAALKSERATYHAVAPRYAGTAGVSENLELVG